MESDFRYLYFENQLYYSFPFLILFAISFFRLALKKISLQTFFVELLFVSLISSEIRFFFTDKIFVTSFSEGILFFIVIFCFIPLLFFKKIVCPVPRPVLFALALLGIVHLISSFLFSEHLLRSLRGITLLYEELLIVVSISSLLVYKPSLRNFKFFEMLPVMAIAFLVSGFLVSLQVAETLGINLFEVIKGRFATFPIGVNNTAAGVASVFAIFSIVFAIQKKSHWYYMGSLIFLSIVFFTNSRNGILTVFFGLCMYISISNGTWIKKIASFFALSSAVVILFFSGILKTQFDRLLFLELEQTTRGFWGGRLELWNQSLEHFYQHPIFGTGIYNVEFIDSNIMAANILLQELISGGIIALIFRILFILLILRYGYSSIKKHERPEIIAIFCTLAGGLFFSLFEPYFYTYHHTMIFSCFIAIMFALIHLHKKGIQV